MKLLKIVSFFSLSIILTTFMYGCAANQYHLKRSIALTEAFEGYQVQPDYTYYYSGPSAMPDAVLGIKKGYQFEPGLWKPVQISEKMLKDWQIMIGTYNEPSFGYRYYASYILDENGEAFAIWYSYTDFPTVIKRGENHYEIHTPTDRNLARPNRGLIKFGM